MATKNGSRKKSHTPNKSGVMKPDMCSMKVADLDRMLADAFERGRTERTGWYERHINEQFVDGPGGTKFFSGRIPQHERNAHGTLSQAIAAYVERIERKASLWDSHETLQAALEEHKEPWIPKVGSVCRYVDDNGEARTACVDLDPAGVGVKVVFSDGDHRFTLPERLQQASDAEVSAYHREQELRQAKEKAEEEARKPIAFGTPVHVKAWDCKGVVIGESETTKGLWLVGHPESSDRRAGMKHMLRSEFTLV